MKRRNSAIIIALAAVAMLATGCKKEQTGKTVTLGASMASNNTKVYIDGYTPKWNEGDQVNVNGTAYSVSNISGGTADIQGVADASDFRCVYPSSIVTSGLAAESGACNVTLPTTQNYSVDGSGHQTVAVPMSGATNGMNVTFHNLCSVLKVSFTNSTASSVTLRKVRVTAASSLLSGSGTAQVTGEESDMVTLASGEKYVDLVLGNSGVEVTNGASKDFYIVLPEFTSQNVTIEFVRMDNMQKSLTLSGVSLGHNKLVSKTVTVSNSNEFNTRHMPGVFSVGPGTKVKFSQGNLVYNRRGSGATKWYFHTHQYDRVNTGSGYVITYTTGNATDLLCWGATGLNNLDPDGSTGLAVDSDLSGDNDWGTAYNSANSTSDWRTLRQTEWNYLLNTRGTANSWARYAKVTISVNSGVKGLIIFPDGVSISGSTATLAGVEFNNANQSGSNFSKTISESGWNDLEAAGCVFLPAAGFRDGTSIMYPSDYCQYWSTTPYSSSAYYVNITTNSLKSNSYDTRKRGLLVRLVQDK